MECWRCMAAAALWSPASCTWCLPHRRPSPSTPLLFHFHSFNFEYDRTSGQWQIYISRVQIEQLSLSSLFDIWTSEGSKLWNVKKSATCAIKFSLRQPHWWHIWKSTAEKSRIIATCVIMHPLTRAVWGNIWKCTVEKSQTNATSVPMHPLTQVIWGNIWKPMAEKRQKICNLCDFSSYVAGNLWTHLTHVKWSN